QDEERERNRAGMGAADVESIFYRYYCKLQPVVQAINQQREILREFSTREGVTLETRESRLDPRVANGHAARQTITLFSRRAVRQHQRQLPPILRFTEASLVRLTAALPAGGWSSGWFSRGGRGGGCYDTSAAGAALGGVPDPDVDALLRSSQHLRKRLAVDIAAPERLYARAIHMRAAQARRLSSRRRSSFDEGYSSTRVDKHRSDEDLRWASMLSRYWNGVDNSLGATRYLQISEKKCRKLGDQRTLRGRRGSRALHKFLRGFGPGSVDPDVASVRERGRRGRAHSLCAPERLHAATVTWETRHKKLQMLLRAAAKRGLPASGDSMKWTKTAERWGGLAPPPRRQAPTPASLKMSGRTIVARAARRGWDLRPSSQQVGRGTTVWKQDGGEQYPGPQTLSTVAPTSGGGEIGEGRGGDSSASWSAYEDDTGKMYYVNDVTGESAWELPPDSAT
ncbi:unnamed protein product, partial [Sphacelaria rigidula]